METHEDLTEAQATEFVQRHFEKGSLLRLQIEEEIPMPKRKIDPQEELLMACYGFVDGKIPWWEQRFNKESGRWED